MLYICKNRIKCNGESFQEGEVIDLHESDAKPLLQSGSIEPVKKPFARSKKPTPMEIKDEIIR
jgi:hypothetical protein